MLRLEKDVTFRIALWTVHGKKCFYGGGPISFREMEVDHLIPQTLNKEPEKLTNLKAECGLDLTFDIFGQENLVPSCKPCNAKKRDTIYQARMLILNLESIRKKIPRLEVLISDLEKQAAKDLSFADALVAMRNDTPTREEIREEIRLLDGLGRKRELIEFIRNGSSKIFFTPWIVKALETNGRNAKDFLLDVKNLLADPKANLREGDSSIVRTRFSGNSGFTLTMDNGSIVEFHIENGKMFVSSIRNWKKPTEPV